MKANKSRKAKNETSQRNVCGVVCIWNKMKDSQWQDNIYLRENLKQTNISLTSFICLLFFLKSVILLLPSCLCSIKRRCLCHTLIKHRFFKCKKACVLITWSAKQMQYSVADISLGVLECPRNNKVTMFSSATIMLCLTLKNIKNSN